MWNDRTKLLIGDEGVNKLAQSHVAVIGIGGVGGYAAVLLARAGVGKITIVDFDKVEETNINRQIVADTETLGQFKTDVMQKLLSKINPNLKLRVLAQRISDENVESVLGNDCDYVVDAIDNVTDKINLITYCKTHSVKIVSAMGAGNRVAVPNFEVMDIFKTQNDGLAKVLRKKLKEKNIASLDVVCSNQAALKTQQTEEVNQIGSISYQPAMCGCVLAGFVVNKLLKTK